ncbi:MAG: DUF177 domain-containing protein [Calditrichaeota bacterium]|nr:MAG: DUF177 domain-containing protein [Calditrichota bacterium]
MKILLSGLNQGLTQYSEDVSSDFLPEKWRETYPETLHCAITVDRFRRELRVRIHLDVNGHYRCDRCLADFERPQRFEHEQVYKVGDGPDPVDDDVIELPADAVEIDLQPVLKEILILNHPLKLLCKEECAGLCPGCGADLNKEACRCDEDGGDPRWAQLRKLLK